MSVFQGIYPKSAAKTTAKVCQIIEAAVHRGGCNRSALVGGCLRCHSERLEEELFGIGGHLWLFHGVTQSEKKPSPEVFQIAAARLGLAPTACLVIEDAVNGIVAARGAGCFSAGVTTSFSEASLREAGVDFVVGSYSELKTLLTARETNGIGASGNHKPQ